MFGLSLTHEFYAPFRTVQNCASFDTICGQFQRIFTKFSDIRGDAFFGG
jgi:hypothetical protein